MSTKVKSVMLLGVAMVMIIGLAGCATVNPSTAVYSYSSKPIGYHTYKLPPAGNDVIGRNKIVRSLPDDNFDTIGKRYDVGALELLDANPGYNPYSVFQGSKILIPGEYILPPLRDRKGIVINIAELRLYYFGKDNTVMTFPVALGRQGWSTPLGETYVFRKQKAPTWHVPKTIRDAYFKKTGHKQALNVPPGPQNPLGHYAIYLHLKGYLIHGTNNPASIGRLVSSGCIRMFNNDVAALFKKVNRGTPVNIIYYPNKAGWRDGQLYLEAHTAVNQQDKIYAAKGISAQQAIDEIIASREPVELNSSQIKKTVRKHKGVPRVIGFSPSEQKAARIKIAMRIEKEKEKAKAKAKAKAKTKTKTKTNKKANKKA